MKFLIVIFFASSPTEFITVFPSPSLETCQVEATEIGKQMNNGTFKEQFVVECLDITKN